MVDLFFNFTVFFGLIIELGLKAGNIAYGRRGLERGFLLATAVGHVKLFSVDMLRNRGLINWEVNNVA